jgi:uncharacterized repeat protein (TIGR03803 family)
MSLGTAIPAYAAAGITELFGFPCNALTLQCADGRDPVALFQSSDGNFYGVAAVSQNINRVSRGGTVFKITAGGQFTLLFTFTADNNGNYPEGDVPNHLVEGADGFLYGTAAFGGSRSPGVLDEDGVIFKVSKSGTGYTVLHNFCASANCTDGANPTGFILGSDGNFYGTAQAGGSFQGFSCQTNGCGVVFRITPGGGYSVLHTFVGTDGAVPLDVTQASDGNFYGTTFSGSSNVFRVTASGQFTVLHSFAAPSHPASGVTQASSGLLYGVSSQGTTVATAYSISTSGTFQQVIQITEASNRFVIGKFLRASDGNLWTTSSVGGSGFGTVFAMAPSGAIVETFSFSGTNGSAPTQGVVEGSDGNLYGTTSSGGKDSQGKSAFGVIFTLNAGLPH